MSAAPQAGGCDQPGLMPFEQALAQLLGSVTPTQALERLSLSQALGRVLAEDLCAGLDVPPSDNSAMDGYAVRMADLLAANGTPLRVSQRIPAGVDPEALEPGTVARIFTGATVPAGADTVVMQEHARPDGDGVIISTDRAAGEHIRRRGQDIAMGAVVVAAGVRLQPQHLGVLASIGVAEFPCYKRLRVAVLSSGDELAQPGQIALPGQIYNSNRFLLLGLIQQLGMEWVDLGTVEDTLEATIKALAAAAEDVDCIITSGGVSVGEEDHIKPAVEALGEISLWKLAIKPGKPLAFGRVKGVPFIGLPGNPVAAMLCFQMLARPVLLKMQGDSAPLRPGIQLPIHFSRPRPQQRREYIRVQRQETAQGTLLQPYANQSSGVLTSVAWADGYAVIPAGVTVESGDLVEFIAFTELG
ncbi:MAG: molybdopterin molybdotransferase [Motiliproteus sp.]|jgi:molybdopterin molybdotransferase